MTVPCAQSHSFSFHNLRCHSLIVDSTLKHKLSDWSQGPAEILINKAVIGACLQKTGIMFVVGQALT